MTFQEQINAYFSKKVEQFINFKTYAIEHPFELSFMILWITFLRLLQLALIFVQIVFGVLVFVFSFGGRGYDNGFDDGYEMGRKG